MSNVDQDIARANQKRQKRLNTVLGSLAVVILLIVGAAFFFVDMSTEPALPALDNSMQETSRQSDSTRQEAQQRLASFEAQLNQAGLNSALVAYEPNVLPALSTDLKRVLNVYTSGDSAQSLELAGELQDRLDSYREQVQNAQSELLAKAERNIANTQYTQARTHLNQLLSLDSTYEPAFALQRRIQALDEIATLYEQANVAKVERNLEKQKQIFQQILLLDPGQQRASQSLADVESSLIQLKFDNAIRNSNVALESYDFEQATVALQQAEQIIPNSQVVSSLRQKLVELKKEQKRQSLLSQLETFAQADEWPTVLMLSKNASQAFPNDSRMTELGEQANLVVDSQQEVNGLLQRPNRLSDATIESYARQVARQMQKHTALSPKLQDSVNQLIVAIEQHSTPLNVKVLSDNKTFIRVLGKGVVGQAKQKAISLKPGSYTFEGKRNGYRTVLINVELTPGEKDVQVTVICSEKVSL